MVQANADTLAAVVIEPLVQAAAGMIGPRRDICPGSAKSRRQYNVLLIADEVAVGIGRTGTMFACGARRDVIPDILCLAKGLTGGYLPWPPP